MTSEIAFNNGGGFSIQQAKLSAKVGSEGDEKLNEIWKCGLSAMRDPNWNLSRWYR